MVSKFTQPDCTTQDPSAYKAGLDGAIAVLAQLGAGFSPRAEDTPSMKVVISAGVTFNRATGGFNTIAEQLTAAFTAHASLTKYIRIYISEDGTSGSVESTSTTPSYPANCFPVAKVVLPALSTSITNSIITDERAWNSNYGSPKNTFLFDTSGTTSFPKPTNAKFYRLSAAAGGGGGGGGSTNSAMTNHGGGGAGGGGASILNRLWNAEDLTLVVGARGAGGASGTTYGSTGVAGTDGADTTITGASGSSVTCLGGKKGTAATGAATPISGTGGAGGAAGTGVAGTAGGNGFTSATVPTGGNGGGVGTGGTMGTPGLGGTSGSIATAGSRGAGGGGGVYARPLAASSDGQNGGDGFVLLEVF